MQTEENQAMFPLHQLQLCTCCKADPVRCMAAGNKPKALTLSCTRTMRSHAKSPEGADVLCELSDMATTTLLYSLHGMIDPDGE